jgi:putative (di)nucleoside polyphosphate hydrolase
VEQRIRVGVAAVIADSEGRVLVLERRDVPGAWQFPQGGLRENEEPHAAIEREIREETGLGAGDLRLMAVRPDWLPYFLPAEYRSDKTEIGQIHKWYLFRAAASHPSVQLSPNGEFRDFSWRAPETAVADAVDFRRPVYEKVMEVFGPLLADTASMDDRGYDYVKTEFEHTYASFLNNEEMGERRIANLITLVAFLAAAVGLMADRDWGDPNVPLWVAAGAAVSGLGLGWLTFRRILNRNITTTTLLMAMRRQRHLMVLGHPAVVDAQPFPDPPKTRTFWPEGGRSGLAEMAAAVNSILAASTGAVIVAAFEGPGLAAIGVAVVMVLGSWRLHAISARKAYKPVNEELRRATVTHGTAS